MNQDLLIRIRQALKNPRIAIPAAAIAVVLIAAIAAVVVLLAAGGGGDDGHPVEPEGFTILPSGEDVGRLEPVRVTFGQPPARRNGEEILSIEPAVEGQFAWLTDRTLLFQPAYPGYLRGFEYRLRVKAQPDAGLQDDHEASFTAEGKLAVVSVIPADGDEDVPEQAQVFVQFNRSVAPLTLLDARDQSPVLQFNPPLAGSGEWLNTSLYRFVPGDLAPNTTYRVTIAAGLTSAADGVLEEDYSWAFTSFGPALVRVTPDQQTQYAAPRQPVTLEFNQPMDRAAVESGFRLQQAEQAIAGTFAWSENDSKAVFTPSGTLAPEALHEVIVPAGLPGANGGTTRAEWRSSFRTVGPLRIVRTEPPNGAGAANRYGVSITFSQPIDLDSLEGKVSISGIPADELDPPYGDELTAYYYPAMKPSTTYTVTIAAGVVDRYGQPLAPTSFTFTTAPLEKMVNLAIPNYMSTYSGATEPVLYFHTANVDSASFTLWPLTESERGYFLGQKGRPFNWTPSQPPIRRWSEPVPPAPDEVQINSTSLSGDGPLPLGDYYVLTGGGSYNSEMAFSVVNTAIVLKVAYNELLAWVLDYETGEPLSGVTLQATGSGGLLAPTATTNASGLATFPLTSSVELPPYTGGRFFTVTLRSDGRYGIASTEWQRGAYPWELDIPLEYYPIRYKGHLYSDRPIYRPGETVEIKGVIRDDDDARYRVPADNPEVDLVIRDPQGTELQRERVALNEYGSFAASLVLAADASTGDYYVDMSWSAEMPDGLKQPVTITATSFLVAEFVRPEFEVTVEADEPAYANGDTITATATASYFFGGGVPGAAVSWAVLASPYSLRLEDFSGYSFSDFDYWQFLQTSGDPVRATGSGTTDNAGRFTFQVPAQLLTDEGPQTFTLAATITDANAQAVAGSTTVTVHPADRYAGIRPVEYLAISGEEAQVDLVTVTKDGEIIPGVSVRVDVYKRRWVTTKVQTAEGGRQYRSEPVDELATTVTAVTGADGTGRATFTAPSAGTLRIVAVVTDDSGREARSATYLWVAGPEFASWRVTNDDLIELVADKESYSPGETAEILVPAPFEGAIGLVTVERGKIHTREVRQFPTTSERLSIPITDSSVPNVFVSVVLYRAPTADDPLPRYKIGYVKLPVSTVSRQLTVAITADKEQAQPGETVNYTIKVTDSQGRPVQSELSVAVVDKAVLSLQEERSIDGLRAFWFERGLGVITSSSLAVSVDRANDVIAAPGGGGKGGGGFDEENLRTEFRNTAYWEAQVTTDASGVANVTVPLPDNLTTWRLQARAISGDILVGESTHELVSTRPLLLRPALPLFLRAGDELSVRLLVRNSTSESMSARVAVEAEGIVLGNDDEQRITIAPGESEMVQWPASAPAAGTAKVTFKAVGDNGYQDGVVIEFPVHLDVTPESVATGGVVIDEPAFEAVYLPEWAILENGSLDVRVQPSLTGSMTSELPSFFPRFDIRFESASDVASRTVAIAGVLRGTPEGASSGLASTARLRSDVADLLGKQRADGGWAWCQVYCPSDPLVTAWVLIALGEAQTQDIAVDSGAIARADSYLSAHMNRIADVENPIDPNERAMFLYALAVAGRANAHDSEVRALIEQYQAQLTSSGRAYALLALHEAGEDPEDLNVSRLLNGLVTTVEPSANGNHWEDPRKTGFVRSASQATALALLALTRVQPGHPLIEETVRWLMVARTAQPWESGPERATAVLALSEFAASTGELGGAFGYQVKLDSDSILDGQFQANQPATSDETSVALDQVGRGKVALLEFLRKITGGGRMYYTLDLRYLTPAKDVESLNRGFAISHEYSLLDDAGTPVTTVELGDIVRIKVTVLVSQQRNYVLAEDHLPAGLEPIDPRLATTDPALIARLEEERRQTADQGYTPPYWAPWYRWYYSPWKQVDLRDDRLELRTDRLPAGVHEYIYYARATTPGTFFVAPAHAEEGFFPEVFGRSDSSVFVIQ